MFAPRFGRTLRLSIVKLCLVGACCTGADGQSATPAAKDRGRLETRRITRPMLFFGLVGLAALIDAISVRMVCRSSNGPVRI